MKCKKIQHFLITDYLDDEISLGLRKDIEQHLKSCNRCLMFFEELKAIHAPLKNIKPIEPPVYVWQRIREKIITEPTYQAPSVLVSTLARLRELFLPYKPQLAMVTLALILVFTFVLKHLPFESREPSEVFTEEEKSVMFVFNGNGAVFMDDFGTEIEEYFL